eukprot:TRINITY_DN9315_c0_g3_i2.p1 TRINITY_DN9315_c0_g3~~TRINITY_DN9315_c0_g3_i2.p1  ORF type:complete len:304 (-),score=64.57 TRINITY_DN9315_c0_g3_i2:82-993(-)
MISITRTSESQQTNIPNNQSQMDLRDADEVKSATTVPVESASPSKKKLIKGISTRPNLKTPKQIAFLQKTLHEHELLKNIDEMTRDQMIERMWRKEVPNETRVINEGDVGVHFYVIEKGEFEVYRSQSTGAGEKFDMMVNCPGQTPKQIAFLQKTLHEHELLKNIDEMTRDQMIERMWRKEVPNETRVINEGDVGVHFYVIEKGEFEVYRSQSTGAGEKFDMMVNCLGRGTTFGELSFVKNAPRAASVVASEDSVVWVLDRETWDTANEVAVLRPRFHSSNSSMNSTGSNKPLQDDEMKDKDW